MGDSLTVITTVLGVLSLGGLLIAVLCRGVPRPTLVPLLVYELSYLLTYVVGAVIIATTGGSIYALYWGRSPHLPAALLQSELYWGLLLAPLVLVPVLVRVLATARRVRGVFARAPKSPQHVGILVPLVLYALCGAFLARNPTYRTAWLSPFEYLQGNLVGLYARRGELLAGMPTIDAAILYTVAPFLAFTITGEALERRSRLHFLVAIVTVLGTAASQLVLAQAGPTLLFGLALFVSVLARGVRRNLPVLIAVGVVVVAFSSEYFAMKIGERGVARQLLEPLLRMPCVYPFYLLFVQMHGHPGPQLLALVSAGRLGTQTPWPTIIGTTLFRGREEAYEPAPAHVIAYCDSGFAYAGCTFLVIAIAILLCGRILDAGRSNNVSRSLGISVCCSIYMTTQSSLSALFFEGYGVFWALLSWVGVQLIVGMRDARSRLRVVDTRADIRLVGRRAGR